MSEPHTIRIKDLQPGDTFRMGNVEYEVKEVNARIRYGYLSERKREGKISAYCSFGLKCQARVELIQARG